MKPNPMPKEGCTVEEENAFLKTHVENQNELIEQLKKAALESQNERELRAWGVDRAVRLFENHTDKAPDAAIVLAIARQFVKYADGGDAQ